MQKRNNNWADNIVDIPGITIISIILQPTYLPTQNHNAACTKTIPFKQTIICNALSSAPKNVYPINRRAEIETGHNTGQHSCPLG